MENYESICIDSPPKLKSYINEKFFPKGVIVVCNQNFKDYAGPFSYHGIYLPHKYNLNNKSNNNDTKEMQDNGKIIEEPKEIKDNGKVGKKEQDNKLKSNLPG